jgi:hypothetical protein
VTSQLERYESLVRDIYPKLDLEMAKIVDQALGKVCENAQSIEYNRCIPLKAS